MIYYFVGDVMKTQSDFPIYETMTFQELLDIINNYPKLKITSLTNIKQLENLPAGNYLIDNFPLPTLLEQFPYSANCNGEIQLLKITNLWILSISKKEYTYYSGELSTIIKNGTQVQFNIHSHPYFGKNINVGIPSIADLKNGNSQNKLLYIIHDKGILEYDISSIADIDRDLLDIMWGKFIYSNPSYSQIDFFLLENMFYDEIGLKRRNITLDEFYEICTESKCLKEISDQISIKSKKS